MTNPALYTCEEFDATVRDYLDGTLLEHEARRVELHASNCARCETLLDNATKHVVAFTPQLPPETRESVLRAIATAPTLAIVRDEAPGAGSRVNAQPRWSVQRAILPLLAVAAVLAVVITSARRDAEPALVASDVQTDTANSTSPNTAPIMDHDVGFVYTASRVASAQAQDEFDVLDAASAELESALAQSPNDRELRAFLMSVRARRDELTRRVREASS